MGAVDALMVDLWAKTQKQWYIFSICLPKIIGSLSKHDFDGSKNVIWKRNFAFLQSFFNYSKSLYLKNVFFKTTLELNWNQRLGHKTTLNICHHMLTSSTHLQNRSFHVVERWKMHVQSVQKYCFPCQICKFVGFLLPSSSWLLKAA